MKLLYKILLILSFSFSFGQSSVCDTAEAMCSGNQGPFNNLSGQPNNNSLGCLGDYSKSSMVLHAGWDFRDYEFSIITN